jgi:hypothetical protein
MTDPEAAEHAQQRASSWKRFKGEDAISILLFFPSAYLLHYYSPSPFAFLGLLGVWLFINVYFRLLPPGLAALLTGLGVGFLYGRTASLLGANTYLAVFAGVTVYPLGYLAGVLAAESLYPGGPSGR